MIHHYPTYYNLEYRWSKKIPQVVELLEQLLDGHLDSDSIKQLYRMHISDKDIIGILTNRGDKTFAEYLEYITTQPITKPIQTKTIEELRRALKHKSTLITTTETHD